MNSYSETGDKINDEITLYMACADVAIQASNLTGDKKITLIEKNAFFVHRRIRWETLHVARMGGTKSMTPSALWINAKILLRKQGKIHKHLEQWEPSAVLRDDLRWYCTELCARLRNTPDRVTSALRDGFHLERPKNPDTGKPWQHAVAHTYDIDGHVAAHIAHLSAWRATHTRPDFLRWDELTEELITTDDNSGRATEQCLDALCDEPVVSLQDQWDAGGVPDGPAWMQGADPEPVPEPVPVVTQKKLTLKKMGGKWQKKSPN